MSSVTAIRRQLKAAAEPGYRRFVTSLITTTAPEAILGVRVPGVYAIAKSHMHDADIDSFLTDLPHRYHEENLAHGYLICHDRDFDRTMARLQAFLPYVDNWSVCDGLRPLAIARHPDAALPYIEGWLADGHPYTVRFAIGMLMAYYLDECFQPRYLGLVAGVRADDYYVMMMAAWYFATALAKQYDAALPYLEQGRLDGRTHERTIRKALESYRVTDDHKGYLRTLRGINRRKQS